MLEPFAFPRGIWAKLQVETETHTLNDTSPEAQTLQRSSHHDPEVTWLCMMDAIRWLVSMAHGDPRFYYYYYFYFYYYHHPRPMTSSDDRLRATQGLWPRSWTLKLADATPLSIDPVIHLSLPFFHTPIRFLPCFLESTNSLSGFWRLERVVVGRWVWTLKRKLKRVVWLRSSPPFVRTPSVFCVRCTGFWGLPSPCPIWEIRERPSQV